MIVGAPHPDPPGEGDQGELVMALVEGLAATGARELIAFFAFRFRRQHPCADLLLDSPPEPGPEVLQGVDVGARGTPPSSSCWRKRATRAALWR